MAEVCGRCKKLVPCDCTRPLSPEQARKLAEAQDEDERWHSYRRRAQEIFGRPALQREDDEELTEF